MTNRNPPYSLVCRNRHVPEDELTEEPLLSHNGENRCEERQCNAPVFSHCTDCKAAIPGYMNGTRGRTTKAGQLRITQTEGLLSSQNGPKRTFRTSCPSCNNPYPWANNRELIKHHAEHLVDLERGESVPLPLNLRAEAAYNKKTKAQTAQRKGAQKAAKNSDRDKRADRSDRRWKRLGMKAGVLTAVVLLIVAGLELWGYDSIKDIWDDDKPPTEQIDE